MAFPTKTLEEIAAELNSKIKSGEITPEEADLEYIERLEWDYGMFLR